MDKEKPRFERSTDHLQVVVRKKAEDLHEFWSTHRHARGWEADFAMELMKTASGLMPVDSSVEYQRFRLMTGEEVADHAIATAARAFNEFKRLGWIVPAPAFEDLKDVETMRPGFRGE